VVVLVGVRGGVPHATNRVLKVLNRIDTPLARKVDFSLGGLCTILVEVFIEGIKSCSVAAGGSEGGIGGVDK
jgi:hypothetical protein